MPAMVCNVSDLITPPRNSWMGCFTLGAMGGPGSSLLCSWGAGLISSTEMFNKNIC